MMESFLAQVVAMTGVVMIVFFPFAVMVLVTFGM